MRRYSFPSSKRQCQTKLTSLQISPIRLREGYYSLFLRKASLFRLLALDLWRSLVAASLSSRPRVWWTFVDEDEMSMMPSFSRSVGLCANDATCYRTAIRQMRGIIKRYVPPALRRRRRTDERDVAVLNYRRGHPVS